MKIAIVVLVVYLGFAFGAANFNIALWSEPARWHCTTVMFCAIIVALLCDFLQPTYGSCDD
jgi:hypothetical protein